jgi:hypothetical protein
MLSALVLSAACSRPVEIPQDPPYISGMITRLDSSSVRVEENPSESSGSAKAVLRLERSTAILWRSGEVATIGDLRLGTQVRAWVGGSVQESYPVRANARVLVIDSTTPPAELGPVPGASGGA